MTRILICGGRDMNSSDVWNWLEKFLRTDVENALGYKSWPPTAIIHGGARGADEGAGQWAESEGIKPTVYKANWKKHGKAAGPIRNRKMIDEGKPDIVVAFPGGAGTKNMVEQAESAGIPVIMTQS